MPYSLSEWIYLSTKNIDENVTQTKPGAYVLDKMGGRYKILYVGRADKDLNDRLKKYVGSDYAFFAYDYATSPKNAFEKECEIYHDHNPPDNKIHPDRPDGADWQCPRCDVFKE